MRIVRRPLFVVLSMFASLLMLADVAVAVKPTEVLATGRNEFDGTAEDGYFAFTRSRAGQPRRFDAYLKPPGLARIRVNSGGSRGYHPALDMGNPTLGDALVFVQLGDGDADLKIWDVDSGGRSNPPLGVNSPVAESKPSLDGEHLLFGRGPESRTYIARVILFNLVSHTSIVVDTAPPEGTVYPGTVSGDWATWTECSPSDCRVWRYQISTATKSEVPSGARLIYTSAVGDDGTVWFVQSRKGCGANVKIRRQEIGAAPTTLVDFRPGIDANISDLDESVANRRLYFARVKCSILDWNIYRVAGDG
ncbi:MAG: hypothetical protein ACRDGO_03440 [Actinomycetota bacterium]